jgi:acyl-CoA synthetase (NDP forming)
LRRNDEFYGIATLYEIIEFGKGIKMEKIVEWDFESLFNPKSIALIGASNNIGKWGAIVFLNIRLGGYQGRLYPVNPKEETVLGYKAYTKVSQIPDPVDLAIIAIPAHLTKEAILDCIQKGIRMAIVITSDFSETGEEGSRLEKELTEIARTSGLRLVGPNTMGIFSASASLTALMPPVRPRKGKVSLVSQSGNIGTQMLGWGEKFAVGFSKYVSSGNEGDLRSEDYLDYLGKDPDTQVILFYIEGLDDGREFVEKSRKITPHKPIIAFKGGKTIAGARAAKSHSGAMAGVKELYEAAFRQAGILWASTTEEMLEWAAAFSSLPIPRGNRVGILTRGGGWGVITADACNELGLEVPPLDDSITRALDGFLPSYWSRGNPVDMVATIGMEAYIKCLEALTAWDKIDAVISLSGDAGPLAMILPDAKRRAETIIPPEKMDKIMQQVAESRTLIYQRVCELIDKYQKPIFAVGANLVKGKGTGQPDSILAQFRTPERAAKAAGVLSQYSRYRQAIRVE